MVHFSSFPGSIVIQMRVGDKDNLPPWLQLYLQLDRWSSSVRRLRRGRRRRRLLQYLILYVQWENCILHFLSASRRLINKPTLIIG